MLAVKFYHLRSLIHRPCLSLARDLGSSLQTDPTSIAERQRLLNSKGLCVSSARDTARLLYGLEDKKNLVHDFPWWQMISCLICASSILLVATLDVERDNLSNMGEMDGIEEDADICLKVFEALSISSHAARLARDMMQGLKETRHRAQGTSRLLFGINNSTNIDAHPLATQAAKVYAPLYQSADQEHALTSNQQLLNLSGTSASRSQTLAPFVSFRYDTFGSNYEDQSPFLQDAVSEPIMWSAQFVNNECNPFLNSEYDEFG